jgi:hypothetical protein
MLGIPSSRPVLLNKKTRVSKRLSEKDFLVIRRKGKLDGSCQWSGTVCQLFFGGEVEREPAKGVFGRVNRIYPSGVTKNDLPVTHTRR